MGGGGGGEPGMGGMGGMGGGAGFGDDDVRVRSFFDVFLTVQAV
jgi:hypothetical protein